MITMLKEYQRPRFSQSLTPEILLPRRIEHKVLMARESMKKGAQFCSPVMKFISQLTSGANHKAS